jgi:hypothetical protein
VHGKIKFIFPNGQWYHRQDIAARVQRDADRAVADGVEVGLATRSAA